MKTTNGHASDALAALHETARRAPAAPGVYRWLDADGDVLYVGKAKDLRKRLASYFRGGAAAPGGRTAEMVSRARTIEYVVTGSETEALLLEDNFIKEARPPFNLRLRDDKSYPFIEITLSDEWPARALLSRSPRPGQPLLRTVLERPQGPRDSRADRPHLPVSQVQGRQAWPPRGVALPAVLHRPLTRTLRRSRVARRVSRGDRSGRRLPARRLADVGRAIERDMRGRRRGRASSRRRPCCATGSRRCVTSRNARPSTARGRARSTCSASGRASRAGTCRSSGCARARWSRASLLRREHGRARGPRGRRGVRARLLRRRCEHSRAR